MPAQPDAFAASAIERFRSETPLVAAGRNHLNHAGASPSPEVVLAAVREYQEAEAVLGGYETAAARADEIRAVYAAVGALLGTAARNVALVENATVGFSQALSAFDWRAGDVLLTTRHDYVSNFLHFLSLRDRCGVELVVAPDAGCGGVDPGQVAALVEQHAPKLVTLTWMPTNSGLLQPAAEVGAVCREHGVPYLVDACQVVGQVQVNVGELGCDFLSATGRKFLRGPRGTGMLYVSDRMLEAGRYPLFVDLHGATWVSDDRFELDATAARFENWEFNYALLLGLGAAARYAIQVGLERIEVRTSKLAASARELATEAGLRVLDQGQRLGAIVTVDAGARDAAAAVEALRGQGIHTSSMDRGSAVLDLDAKGAQQLVRLSPHYFNTEAEVAAGVEALAAALAG